METAHASGIRLDTILSAGKAISEATSRMFRRDEILDDVCREIQQAMRFDLVTIQLIRFDEDVIEAAHGVGLAEKWTVAPSTS